MGRRYRQLLLFLAVLVLPSVMIAVQGWRLSVQEQELAKTRSEEIRKRTAAEIGQEIVTRLERIKTQEMANVPGRDPAVVAVGMVEGERLVWPWDVHTVATTLSEESPEFSRTLDAGTRAEYVEKRDDRAADLYRKAVETAPHDTQRAAARLALARTQLRAGQRKAAVATYRDVLKLPSTVTYEGLSSWSSAALPLVELGVHADILERVKNDLESPATWSSVQMYRFRMILEALRDSGDEAVKQDAVSALERLPSRLADLERAENLQRDFPRLAVSATDWEPYKGSELWLVGRSPEGVTARPILLAVRWETIRAAVESDRLSRHAGPRFQTAVNGAGESLSDSLPGLRITFPEGVAADQATGLSPQRSLWGFSFALVALLTFLGGYLLWRDMRRDAHIAELRTQFVSSVSHELKTPLTSIRMFAELLQMRESNDAQQGQFLDTIVSESERLTRLLNNVLDFSRIERGQKTYDLQPAPLAEVVEAAVRTIQYPLTQQGFVLNLNLCDGIPPIAIDRDALQQAILNLLTNAMKYSGEHREIGLRLCAENGAALIQVSDQGIGIPEKEQSRIFEKFYRVPIPENREISGTGLGLSLVAHIVEAHGGSVEVQSHPGEGSTFSIRIPLPPGRPEEPGPEGRATVHQGQTA